MKYTIKLYGNQKILGSSLTTCLYTVYETNSLNTVKEIVGVLLPMGGKVEIKAETKREEEGNEPF